jgi:sulfite reductase (NADPH) hemoprotein beta-component
MAAVDDPKTFGRARLTFADEREVDEFADKLEKFENGELGPDEWRVYRLLRGTYGQRQPDAVHMIRVKIPQGLLTADQVLALADVADRHSRGFGHITTRQNVQFHFVPVADVEAAMRHLAAAGLTTREACGNSVRNITACQYAGISATEAFDVTPYSEALTRFFLRHPLASSLPRKFKIAFEGCSEDHIKAAINDIGWIARVENGKRGFRVTVAGGTAILCTPGKPLFEFLPVEQMFDAAEAIVRVFHDLGDYKHKQRNRMKFLIKAIGWDKFHEAFHERFAAVRAAGGTPLPFDPAAPPVESAPDWARPTPPSVGAINTRVLAAQLRGPGIRPETKPDLAPSSDTYAQWAKTNLLLQKQAGYVTAIVTVPLGDLTSAQMRVIAELAQAYGDGAVRVTAVQDLVIRWVPSADAPELYKRLAAAGLGLGGANTVADVTSCPGAESCKLAVTQSRGLGSTLEEHIRAQAGLVERVPGVDIKVSGCPNGCGQHHIAAIGFQGSLRKVGDRPVPQYFVMVGGGVSKGSAHFGKVVAKVPARRCTTALDRLLDLYARERKQDESAEDYFQRADVTQIKLLLNDLEQMTPETARADDFIDLAESKAFAPETMDGECAT